MFNSNHYYVTMELSDLHKYPEYPPTDIVEEFCNLVLQESEKVPIAVTMGELGVLGDKQWHTYELPSIELQGKIRQWLINNWIENSDEFLCSILIACHNFALDKGLFVKALELYHGEYKWQFENDLRNSKGENIDPWWSLK